GSTEVDLTQAELEVVPAAAVDSRDRFQRGHRRAIHARADGRFTLPAISVRGPLRLVVDHADFAPQRIDLGALEPGAVREVGLRLTAGATLAGHVVDGAGAGVQGAEVHAVVDVQIGAEGYGARETESGPDGAFSLEGVAPGDLTVQAEKRGYLEGRRFLTVAEGQAVADLVLELDEGNSVAGLVHWSDGTPAAGAHVRARFDRSQLFSGGGLNAASGAGGKAECDEEGRFTITGLGMGPFELRASSERDAGGSAAGDGEAQDGSWSARLEHVRPGSEDLLLVLEAPLGIAGRVVDEDERPVTAFEVRAVKTFETPVGPVEQTREERSFEGEDGTFLLSGLERGDWVLHAVADGLAGTEGVSVALAEEGAEGIVIPLVHAGTVSGTVYTPEGVPAADATVFVGAEGPGWKHQVSGAPDLPSATTDGDGAFTLEGVLPGQVEVQGRAEGFATSVSALVDLRPREHVEGVELFLTAGGTLTGEVIGDDERPAASATIQLVHMGEFEIRFTTTDSEGLFRLENLDPGDYQVNAMPRASRMIEMADGESDSLGKLVAELKTAMVEISEGEETHVVLGTPAQDPVEVSGRVTLDGEPYSPAFVTFFREGGDDLSKTRPATTDDEGRYTITVDGAGSYLALVQQMSGALGGQSSVEFTVEVPEGSSFTRDLELPLGRISGLVRGSDGSPAPEERVTLLPGGAAHTGMFWGGRFHGEVRTDEEGRFDLRGLAPGEYVLAVGGMAGGGLFGGEPAHGRLVRGVHVGEGEWIRDLELRLELPGAIEATVTDTSGNLVEGATLFVRNAEGRPVDLISTLTTDAHGRCSYRGLEPGVYTASARQTSGFASQESEPVRVEAGHAAQLSLTVEEGTLLVVQLVDGERRPVRGAVSVVDAEGREVGNLFGLSDILGLMKEGGAGMTANVHRAGPLAPGRYRVTGTGPDGRQVSKPLNLTNRPRRTLTLRFKD
ncbi:MAG: carboxypeptidase-like regulatory domain-containing protein, partial [Planctomycetota bacterium]|nr:carboxypeptidase-like regulatory domain-containing protein [Planctomycetota bacterium]